MRDFESQIWQTVSKLNWKAFFISLIVVFAMTILQMSGLLPNINLNDREKTIIEPLSKIKPLLEKKNNKYKISETYDLTPDAYAEEDIIYAFSYAAVDYDTGKILSEKNLNQEVPVASLTKIMTSIVAIDLASETEEFYISERASREIPTKIGVVPGEKMTLNELLHAALLTSANDAVEVIEEGIDERYGKGTFIKAMNHKAKFLGLENTSFDNPQGFDGANNFSTAHDLLILSHYALENYPTIKEIVSKDYELLPENNNHKKFDLYNWNGLIGVYPNTYGVKIGNTENAGLTTIVTSEREGKKVMAVVLGASDLFDRDLSAANLLDRGFYRLSDLDPIDVTPEQLQEKYDSWIFWE